MRSHFEICENIKSGYNSAINVGSPHNIDNNVVQLAILEVLLDIRDLMVKK
jgi:hypothetical protein